MSVNFKIGDLVTVTGFQDGHTFTGQRGVVQAFRDMFGENLVGINFGGFYSHGRLHTLGGLVPDGTGFWVEPSLLSPFRKPKMGFAKFIERIEARG